jgi:subtilisin-like proprotein convertase family protein
MGSLITSHPDLIMKTKWIIFGLQLLAASAFAQIGFTNDNASTITAGNPSGVLEQINVAGVTGNIANITVSLDIAGGYNGDLYATLTGPDGQMAVLLNRTGVSYDNAFGYADAGFDITLDDSGANTNIHDYGTESYSTDGSGQVTGTYASDGRDIDPQSAPAAFDAASTTQNLGLFAGSDADGTWDLFISSMAGGGDNATLNSFALNVTPVATPEPSVAALGGLALLVCGAIRMRKLR